MSGSGHEPSAAVPFAAVPGQAAAPPQTLSILSLVFGIIGLALSLTLTGVGAVPGIAGVVLGLLARSREPASRAMWLTGVTTGAIAAAIGVITVAVFVIVWLGIVLSAIGAFSGIWFSAR